MLAVPADTPVTIPEDEPIAATDALLVVHEPPETISLRLSVPPAATVAPPRIGPAAGLTVNVIVAIAVPTMYVIVHVPAETPVTIPVEEPTVATAVLLLLQTPPAVESVSVRVPPTQALGVPPMA